jgi:uncharacterized protein YkwD
MTASILGLVVALSLALAPGPAVAKNVCRAACKTAGKACIAPAKAAFVAARTTCKAGLPGAERKACIATARGIRDTDKAACIATRTQCLSACGTAGGGGGGGGGGGQGQCKSKEADWLATLNLYRHLANLPVVTERTEWSAGDQAHATYTAKEDTVGHTEDPMSASYTAAGAEAAANGNVAGHSSPDQGFAWAIDTWMTGPFHALGILDPRLAESGFGIAHDSAGNVQTGAVLDVIRGRSATVSAASFPVVYPADGTALPLDRYAGNELPDPLAPCAGFSQPSGPPIIVQFGSGTPTPLITDIMLTHDGTALSLCAYDANSYSNPDAASQANARNVLANRSAVVIMPKAPFTAGATYRVDMTVDGVSRSWTFTVNCS